MSEITEDSLLIVGGEKRPRGRPRLSEPRSTVSVWLPAAAHDKLIEMAKANEESISATVRHLLALKLE